MPFLHRGNADIVRGTFLGSLAFGVSSGVAGDPRDKTAIAKLRWNQMEPIHTLLSIQNWYWKTPLLRDWLTGTSFNLLALRFSTGCKKKQQFVWWYVFSIAFRSSGSWQVDSTSWVCWSRTVKQTSVFSWALEADAVLSRRRVEVWKHLARAVVSHNFETHFAWSAFKTLGILHFLQYYQTPFALTVLQDGRADFQTGQQAFMGHLITLWHKLWLIPNRNCRVFSRKPWRSGTKELWATPICMILHVVNRRHFIFTIFK